MGNYQSLEIEFVQRTLRVIQQYDEFKGTYDPVEQYDHTLLINCLLGLAILPKEKVKERTPNERLPILKAMKLAGLKNSWFHPDLKTSKDLIIEIRDSAAHFNIKFVSENEDFMIDRIQFFNDRKNAVMADFVPDELRNFVEWFATELISNLQRNQA